MVSGPAIGTLVVFIVSIFFVIQPVSFPIPRTRGKRLYINLTTAPIIAIAILWAAQCLGPREIRNGIVGTDGVKPYNILILFFTLAYMAITLDVTGVLQAAAFWVSNKGGSNGWKLFFYFYIMLTLLSVVLGNDPVILSGTVFLVYYTTANKLDSKAWLMSEFAAANTASMVLFVGNPTNVVICEGFRINNVAFTAYTILPFLGCITTCFIALAIQFRNPKYIPKHLNRTQKFNAREALRDPVGAWVGSLLLGTCLAVILVVSFFHVDVWKISLPFAGAKFLYDIARDHYVSRRRQFMKKKNSDKEQQSSSASDEVEAEDDLRAQFGLEGTNLGEDVEKNNIIFEDARSRSPDNASALAPPPQVFSAPQTRANTSDTEKTVVPPLPSSSSLPPQKSGKISLRHKIHFSYKSKLERLGKHFPTFRIAVPRLPFALVPFAFSQFILIEALEHQGWIQIFANWLVRASNRQIFPSIWIIGVLGVILCNISGTNIGATILLTKVVRAANFPGDSSRAAAIALAVASNIGAVSFTFSASLAGLLWRQILSQRGIKIKQIQFAIWNTLPLLVMTGVGLGIVCAEMAVLY